MQRHNYYQEVVPYFSAMVINGAAIAFLTGTALFSLNKARDDEFK